MSYAGQVNIGLIGDFDAMPDIGVIRRGLNESLAELSRAADEVEASIAPQASGNGTGKRSASTKRQ